MDVVIVQGRTGSDAERKTDSGPATFSLAVDRKVKGESSTIWYRVTVFQKTADFVEKYVRKGKRLTVRGRLSFDPATGGPRVWVGQDGTPRASFELMGDEISIIDWPEKDEAREVAFTGDGYASKAEIDDIPF